MMGIQLFLLSASLFILARYFFAIELEYSQLARILFQVITSCLPIQKLLVSIQEMVKLC